MGVTGRLKLRVESKRKELLEEAEYPVRSFTANFLALVVGMLLKPTGTVGAITVTSAIGYGSDLRPKATNNTTVWPPYNFKYSGPTGQSNLVRMFGGLYPWGTPRNSPSYGIIIGSGTTSPSPDDINLTSPYSTSQFSFADQTMDNLLLVNLQTNTAYFNLSRSFQNISGGSLSVTEAGILVLVYNWATPSTSSFSSVLIVRDVFSAVSVPNQAYITVTYQFKISV